MFITKLSDIQKQPSELFLRKSIYNKFIGEHTCQNLVNFIEITLRHGCSPVKFLHIFGTSFLKSTSGRLLLDINVDDIA